MKIFKFFFHFWKERHFPRQVPCFSSLTVRSTSTVSTANDTALLVCYSWRLGSYRCGFFDLPSFFLFIRPFVLFCHLYFSVLNYDVKTMQHTIHLECPWEPSPFPSVPPHIPRPCVQARGERAVWRGIPHFIIRSILVVCTTMSVCPHVAVWVSFSLLCMVVVSNAIYLACNISKLTIAFWQIKKCVYDGSVGTYLRT